MDILRFISEIKKVPRYLYTWLGLFSIQIFLIIITNIIINYMRGLQEFKDTCVDKFYFEIIFYISLVIIITIIWIFKRKIPKFRTEDVGILFGPCHKESVRNEIDDLEHKLYKEIKNKAFANIVIKRLPPNHSNGSNEDNIKIINKTNARLLIRGNFEKFTKKGKEITGFKSISIAFKELPIGPHEVPYLINDAIVRRRWGWDSENTIKKDEVAINLGQMSRYIVGLSLIAQKKYKESRNIIAPLLAEVEAKFNCRRIPVEIQRYKQTIKKAYIISLSDHVRDEYAKALEEETIFRLPHEKIKTWERDLNEVLCKNEHHRSALMLLAIIKFLSKDIINSKEYIKKARVKTPTDLKFQANCDLSEAFLLAYEGKMIESKKLYKKVLHSKNVPEKSVMDEIFSFIGQAIVAFPDKPLIRFIHGLLNDELGDKILACDEFRRFVSEANNMPRWTREAKKRIERIEVVKGENGI